MNVTDMRPDHGTFLPQSFSAFVDDDGCHCLKSLQQQSKRPPCMDLSASLHHFSGPVVQLVSHGTVLICGILKLDKYLGHDLGLGPQGAEVRGVFLST